MEQASPARLYTTLVGAALVLFGILGFFYSASFGSPGEVDEALGAFAVNGWANVFHILLGALGLLVAGFASRAYAIGAGALLIALAVWGFLLGSGQILGFLPVNAGDNLLHLVLGGLGLLAAVGTPATLEADPAAQRA
jgi:uncharacterized protein DUF4383